MSRWNFDLIENIDPIEFDTYKEFKQWLHNEYNDAEIFVCEPIVIYDRSSLGQEHLHRWYEIIDRYQSGRVKYRKKTHEST